MESVCSGPVVRTAMRSARSAAGFDLRKVAATAGVAWTVLNDALAAGSPHQLARDRCSRLAVAVVADDRHSLQTRLLSLTHRACPPSYRRAVSDDPQKTVTFHDTNSNGLAVDSSLDLYSSRSRLNREISLVTTRGDAWSGFEPTHGGVPRTPGWSTRGFMGVSMTRHAAVIYATVDAAGIRSALLGQSRCASVGAFGQTEPTLGPGDCVVADAITQRLLSDPDPSVRSAAAMHPRSAPPGTFQTLAADHDPNVRVAAAMFCQGSFGVLEALAQDSDERVRHAVAENTHTPVGVLDQLAAHRCSRTRSAALSNPRLSSRAVLSRIDDPDTVVRVGAWVRLFTRPKMWRRWPAAIKRIFTAAGTRS